MPEIIQDGQIPVSAMPEPEQSFERAIMNKAMERPLSSRRQIRQQVIDRLHLRALIEDQDSVSEAGGQNAT